MRFADPIGLAAGLGAGAFWGLSFVVPRWLLDVPPDLVAWGRFLVFGAISLLFTLVWPKARLEAALWRRHGVAIFALATLGYSAYYRFFVEAVQVSGVEVPTLVVGLLPLTTLLVSRARARETLLPPKLRRPLALTLFGLLALPLSRWQAGADAHATLSGFGLSTLCLASWTAYAVGNAQRTRLLPRASMLAWTCATGIAAALSSTLLTAAFRPALFSTPFWSDFAGAPTFPRWVAGVVLLGVLASWLAIYLWNEASRRLRADLLGQLIVSETIFGILFAILLEGRAPRPVEALALASTLTGVALSVRILGRRPVETP